MTSLLGGSPILTCADKRGRVKNPENCADVIYGRPPTNFDTFHHGIFTGFLVSVWSSSSSKVGLLLHHKMALLVNKLDLLMNKLDLLE